MWIDDTNADVIKVDFDALYHGDVLIEGDTSEQFPDLAEAVCFRGYTRESDAARRRDARALKPRARRDSLA